MKKLAIILSLALFSTEGFSFDKFDSSGIGSSKLIIRGEIKQSTCELSTQNINVMLPKVETNQLRQLGANSTPQNFLIKLINCPFLKLVNGQTAEYVSITFSPNSPNISERSNLRNIASGVAATGIEVQILSDNKVINLHDSEAMPKFRLRDTLDGTVAFAFQARYLVTDSNGATAGLFESDIPFSISYK